MAKAINYEKTEGERLSEELTYKPQSSIISLINAPTMKNASKTFTFYHPSLILGSTLLTIPL